MVRNKNNAALNPQVFLIAEYFRSVNQPEQEAAQAAAIDLNGVMPQAAAAI